MTGRKFLEILRLRMTKLILTRLAMGLVATMQMIKNFSCIKVAVEFVSPENVGECLRLTEEFRTLPQDHIASEDKLQVKKMIVHAASQAVAILDENARFQQELRGEDKMLQVFEHTPSATLAGLQSNDHGRREKGNAEQQGEEEDAEVLEQQPSLSPVELHSIGHAWRQGTVAQQGEEEDAEV
ncbi:hypothetical protein EV2_041513 [Malus domestica]